jgi:hypothetical protein
MAEYSKLATGQVVSTLTGGPTTVVLPFVPQLIRISNQTRVLAGTGVSEAWWYKDDGAAAAYLNTLTAGVPTTTYVTTGGFSTFQGALALQYGPQVQIASITKASPAVVTTATPHGLVSGNFVILQGLYQSPTTGMPQIATIPFAVTVTSATTFTINWNTNQSNYTALSGSPAGAYVRQILYPVLYAPGVSVVSALTLGSTTTVTTAAPSNFVVGQEVAFSIPAIWGTTQLNPLPNNITPGSPVYGFVTGFSNPLTFTVNINSTGYTAFNTNPTVAQAIGLSFPLVYAVGDANSGSLLPNFVAPSFYNGTSQTLTPSINGPAVAGAFCNNTSQGFIIGSAISGTTGDIIDWEAIFLDYSV